MASLLADIHKESLPTIQKMLGHKRLTTTEKYVQSLTQDIHQAAAKLELPKQNLSTDPLENAEKGLGPKA